MKEQNYKRLEVTRTSTYAEKLLSVADAAKRLGLADVTIRLWLAARKLGYVRLGRRVLIPESEIQRVIEAGFVPPRA